MFSGISGIDHAGGRAPVQFITPTDLSADDTDDPVVGVHHWHARHFVEAGNEVLQPLCRLGCQHSVSTAHEPCGSTHTHIQLLVQDDRTPAADVNRYACALTVQAVA